MIFARILDVSLQKQSFADVLQNKCSQKFCVFYRKAPVLESLSYKAAGLQPWHFIKKRLQHRCFAVKFSEFSGVFLQNTSDGCFSLCLKCIRNLSILILCVFSKRKSLLNQHLLYLFQKNYKSMATFAYLNWVTTVPYWSLANFYMWYLVCVSLINIFRFSACRVCPKLINQGMVMKPTVLIPWKQYLLTFDYKPA